MSKKKEKKKKKKKKTVIKIEPPTVGLIFDFVDNDFTAGVMIHCTCKKPLSMYNLLSLTESVNRKVRSGIIYTRNNLLHLDPGLFQY